MIYENDFKEYMKNEKECADSTLSAYLGDIKEFEAFLNSKNKNLIQCSSDDIRDFLLSLKQQGRSGSTLNRKMVSVRKYYDYLRSSGKKPNNPTLKVKVPKLEARMPEFLSIEEITRLLEQPDESDLGIRDRAMLELLYACGLKATELSELNIQDVDLRIGFVSCRGDGTKSRIIPMGQPARKALITYMKDSRSRLVADKEDSGALFLNYAGARITRQGVWKIVKFYGAKAGISEDLSPQIIRNSFAAHMIKNGADIKSLQELLGNEDSSTLQLFMALAKTRIMDVYDKTHPRA